MRSHYIKLNDLFQPDNVIRISAQLYQRMDSLNITLKDLTSQTLERLVSLKWKRMKYFKDIELIQIHNLR